MSPSPTEVLLTPYTLGDLQLKNRIVMAPLTRHPSCQPWEGADRVDGRVWPTALGRRESVIK